MARSGVTALTLAVVLALFEFGSCLHCYQCASQTDPTCAYGSKMGKNLVVDCNNDQSSSFNTLFLNAILPRELAIPTIGASKYCHKIVLMNGSVARTCLDSNPNKLNLSCEMIMNASKASRNRDAQIKECVVCDKDECNSAGSIATSLPLAGLALLVSYFYTQ